MPNNQEKASNFLKAINKYAEEQRKEIQKEVEDFKREELEKAEAEVLNDAFQLIQSEMAEMKSRISSDLSKKEMDGKKVLFEKRKAITNEVFKRAKDELLKFSASEEYPKLLEDYTKLISSTLTQPGTVLYIRKEDLKFKDLIIKAFGRKDCKVDVTEDIVIGGIYGYNSEMGIVADESLDSKLEEQHQWFSENSGLKLV